MTISNVIFSRRTFLKTSLLAGGAVTIGCLEPLAAAVPDGSGMSVTELPEGTAPPALPLPHFPTRVHAFVWRNWSLVPSSKMARVLGIPEREVQRIGRALGLGRQPKMDADLEARSYLTVIKRNWHLLPYAQLLQLLGWTPEKLAYTLREDDFLFVKLGNLKPACEPLRYEPPSEVVLAREREIRRIVEEELPPADRSQTEPLFGFLKELARPAPRTHRQPRRDAPLRYCYSYFALYGDPLLETQAESYPEGYLAQLAEAGVNGVWLQAVLYKLAPFPWEPERSRHWEARLRNLQKLVVRAGKQGLRVFLYLNEPRAMPLTFFTNRSHLKGVVGGDHATMCTSLPEVQRYLEESARTIAQAVPDLGGFFTITASENLTSCWSHGQGRNCPRCGARSPAEVIAEVNTLLYRGIRNAGTNARLIAWDWGWNDDWAPQAIERLPKDVAFMSVSEWRLPLERGGVRTEVGEYSISAVGPGPRASRHWEVARRRGMDVVAKIQAGNTWELSSVPYIPALANVARHAENLRKAGVRNQMLGWTLGGYPSPNLEVVAGVGEGGAPLEVMRRVAERRFGTGLAAAVVEAWQKFSTAFSEFPLHIGVQYNGPQQLGPANLLWEKPTGYRASMVGFPYDDLASWRAVYPPDIFAAQLEKVARGFQDALADLRQAAKGTRTNAVQRRAFTRECGVAEAASILFLSSANQARFVQARANGKRDDMRRLLRSEIELARQMFRLQSGDSRLGFEASNHYFFVPVDLAEKILNCRHLLDTMEG